MKQVRITIRTKVKESLERLLIREISLLREVGGQETKEQQEVYGEALEYLRKAENIGYPILYGGQE